MKTESRFLNNAKQQSGSAMTELLLSLALATAMIPFIVRSQEGRVRRAENIIIVRDMDQVRDGLEKYMSEHQKRLMITTGRDITRVKLAELSEYGVSTDIVEKYGDRFQLRIIKSADRDGRATLQGVLVMDNPDITPLRTREIASLGGSMTGFVDGNRVYSVHGTWTMGAGALGGGIGGGLSESTKKVVAGQDYLWRMQSGDIRDATMQSNLSLGERNLINVNQVQSKNARFEGMVQAEKIGTNKLMFNTRPNIDGEFIVSGEANVAGNLSSDSKDLNVSGTFSLAQDARFSNVTAEDLWVNNLYLAGASATEKSTVPILSVGRTLDMSAGRVTATITNIGYSGSITPRLYVTSKIFDAADGEFYWDLSGGDAVLSDMSFSGLNQLMKAAVMGEGKDTETYKIMSAISANQNATVSDFINAISEIKKRVTVKFNALGLE